MTVLLGDAHPTSVLPRNDPFNGVATRGRVRRILEKSAFRAQQTAPFETKASGYQPVTNARFDLMTGEPTRASGGVTDAFRREAVEARCRPHRPIGGNGLDALRRRPLDVEAGRDEVCAGDGVVDPGRRQICTAHAEKRVEACKLRSAAVAACIVELDRSVRRPGVTEGVARLKMSEPGGNIELR